MTIHSYRPSFTRRGFLGTTVWTLLGLSPAFARDPIHQVVPDGLSEWLDGFDTASVGPADVRTSVPTMSPQVVEALQQAIARYSDIAARGGWPVVPTDGKLRIGVRNHAVEVLRQRLTISGDLPKASGNPETFDSYVEMAVRRFQARHGIAVDGIAGETTFAALNVPVTTRLSQLATNLTRLKMLISKAPSERFVMVNIPAARVEAVENGRVMSLHKAVVGRADRPSPIVNSNIIEVNFHPFWTVPASIIRKDLIPIMQKDPDYLTRYRIRIYDPNGNELQPQQIDWTTDEATRYMFRQDPSDDNSLGLVRINFPNPDSVYMHDTPNKSLFNKDERFDSSGCVRIQDVRELVVWLLRDTPGQTREQIDAQFRSYQRLDVKLAEPVAVHWNYITAWTTHDGIVQFRNDIYNLDGIRPIAADESKLPI